MGDYSYTSVSVRDSRTILLPFKLPLPVGKTHQETPYSLLTIWLQSCIAQSPQLPCHHYSHVLHHLRNATSSDYQHSSSLQNRQFTRLISHLSMESGLRRWCIILYEALFHPVSPCASQHEQALVITQRNVVTVVTGLSTLHTRKGAELISIQRVQHSQNVVKAM